MVVWLKVNVLIIQLVLAHRVEGLGEGDECEEGEQSGEGVLEQIGADSE